MLRKVAPLSSAASGSLAPGRSPDHKHKHGAISTKPLLISLRVLVIRSLALPYMLRSVLTPNDSL